MLPRPSHAFVPLLAAAASLATPALAAGVLEINQTCAVGTGCFPGDAAGLPVEIDGSTGRSFRLTGDLVVPVGGTGILVLGAASHLSIDLNGFAIVRDGCQDISVRPNACDDGKGDLASTGILALAGTSRIEVSGGSIIGTGQGVRTQSPAVIRGLRLTKNRGTAIQGGARVVDNSIRDCGDGIVAPGAIVAHNEISNCEGTAIAGAKGEVVGNQIRVVGVGILGAGIIRGNAIDFANEAGIRVENRDVLTDEGALIEGNRISNVDEGRGIETFRGSSIVGNVVQRTSQEGIYTEVACSILDNTVTLAQGDGIFAPDGSAVQRNTVSLGTKSGMVLGAKASYRANTVTSNLGGTVVGGVDAGDNVCDGTLGCP